jgi:uncharacterized protein
MRFHFYLAHPAHFHLFVHTMKGLKERGHSVNISIKSKDVLQNLLEESGLPYINIAPKERKSGAFGAVLGMIQRNLAHFKMFLKQKPSVFVATSAEFAPIARMMGIYAISMFEDDLELFPVYSRVLVPFLNHQLCPRSCSAGPWNGNKKTLKYAGYHELAYLHPNRFVPNQLKTIQVLDQSQKNFLIRFSRLNAWHDDGITGINDSLAQKLINLLEPFGRVWISSERALPAELEKRRIQIPASDILDILSFCDLYIGDSQTMTAEAAVLGTPAVRFNDFVGKIGYLEELEHRYGLCFSFKTDQEVEFLNKVKHLAGQDNLKLEWNKKRQLMLSETIDPSIFFISLLDQYPLSLKTAMSLTGCKTVSD